MKNGSKDSTTQTEIVYSLEHLEEGKKICIWET
jgi:hypothetical protein